MSSRGNGGEAERSHEAEWIDSGWTDEIRREVPRSVRFFEQTSLGRTEMQLKVFMVPVKSAEAIEPEMNAFLRGHRVISVRKEFVSDGENSFWTFCVEYLNAALPSGPFAGKGPKVDYREVLKPEEFEVFSRVREWRKAVAADKGLEPRESRGQLEQQRQELPVRESEQQQPGQQEQQYWVPCRPVPSSTRRLRKRARWVDPAAIPSRADGARAKNRCGRPVRVAGWNPVKNSGRPGCFMN